ncbi:MAG: hypothetical protein LW636_08295 [Planctomycetaceae bacterium]|nr:hypothetical protein [Planctomycetaceae bacterium]
MSPDDGTPNEAAKPAVQGVPAVQGAPAPQGSLSSGQGLRPMRRQDTPRRLKNGIRFRRREGLEVLPWPAEAWSALLFEGVGDTAREEGLDYARAGQTAFLQITPVGGRHLVPTDTKAIARSCSHCHAEGATAPCKHIACVAALVVERIAADPLMAFTLRGLDGQRLLERLQEARAIATRGVARAHSTPPAAEQVPEAMPLDRCLENFWRPARAASEGAAEAEQPVPHALLRRLGQSPLQGKFPLVGLLASIYDSVALHGRELRERETPAPQPSDDA